MRSLAFVFGFAAYEVAAYPWVADVVGADKSLLKRGVLEERQVFGGAATCPFNANHTAAVPISTKYPYCGAVNGVPGKQSCPNNRVPAQGDTAHAYEAPSAKDIRGPCPGINTAANHHFLAHDGVTTFNELVDMQQNVYGVGYDLAVLLAVLGVGLDGDPVTQKLSIGCDASSRTSAAGLTSGELGLDGHNKFEGDTSLTRNDYFPANGNNYLFNATLFGMMSQTAKGNFSRDQLALYRYQRYQQSLNGNGNFYFGPKSLLLFGAASFLYELFPSNGEKGVADQTTMNYFFVPEMLPPNWYSRSDPYTIPLVGNEIFSQYAEHPVAFGGNTGKPNSFVGIGPYNGQFSETGFFNGTSAGIQCLLYQFATENVPSSISGLSNIPLANLQWAASKLNPIYQSAGSACPLNFNSA